MNATSSSTPLAKDASWTGDWIPANFWDAAIIGCVFADKSGTLHVEQSGDGIEADVDTSFSTSAAEGEGFEEPRVGAFWRLRYVNGGTANTVFRISANTRGGR